MDDKQVTDEPIRTPRLLLLAAICAVPDSKTRPIGQVNLQALVDAIWAHERLELPITVDLEVKALEYCYGKDVVVMGTRMEVAAGLWTGEQHTFVKAAWANLQALRALRPRW